MGIGREVIIDEQGETDKTSAKIVREADVGATNKGTGCREFPVQYVQLFLGARQGALKRHFLLFRVRPMINVDHLRVDISVPEIAVETSVEPIHCFIHPGAGLKTWGICRATCQICQIFEDGGRFRQHKIIMFKHRDSVVRVQRHKVRLHMVTVLKAEGLVFNFQPFLTGK